MNLSQAHDAPERASPRPAKRFLLAFALSVVGLSVAAEAGVRASLFWKYAVAASFGNTAFSFQFPRISSWQEGGVAGPYPARTRFTFRIFGPEGKTYLTSQVRTNDLGWVAERDYNAPKKQGEIRVAFLGDSLTASITNDHPWLETVGRVLAERLPGAIAMNLGVPNFGPMSQANLTAPIAKRLGADALVVNLTAATLSHETITLDRARRRPFEPIHEERGVEVPLTCPPGGLFWSGCVVSVAWFSTPALEPEQVLGIRRRATRKVLTYSLLTDPHLYAFSPRSLQSSAGAPLPAPEQIASGVEALKLMRRVFPNLLVAMNPLYQDFSTQTVTPTFEGFMEALRAEGIPVVDMRTRLPQASASEMQSWYNLPFDGHWSDKGAAIYGQAIAELLLERRLASANASP